MAPGHPAEPYLELAARDAWALAALAKAGRDARRDVSDWVVTLHFYTLCIYVKALGRCRGRDIQDHYGIRQWLNSDVELTPIARPYRKIEEWSRDARYEGRLFDAKSEMPRFHEWFVAVRDHLCGLLEREGLRPARIAPVDP
jgi:hypothetical protein